MVKGGRSCFGQEDQRFLGIGIFEPDTAQVLRVVLCNTVSVQGNGLIPDDAAASVHFGRVHAPGVHNDFGSSHKEGACLVHLEQASKVQIAPVHDVERTGLQNQDVQHIDLVHLAIADADECRNGASQVQQGMDLDGSLGFSKRGPVEQAQAQIEGGGVQRVDRVLELQPLVLVQVKLASAKDQNCGQVGSNAPIA